MGKIPAKIGNFPIHDPDGSYLGFAVSGYGLMWNKNYLQAHKLPASKEWTDLVNPKYYGHLVISAPSRSGTTHLTIEVILQAYGWEKGWALLLNSGGNMGTITERSFGVPEAVISGQYGIGVVIDFFGLSAIASGHPVDFAYPSLTSVVPASVGIVKGGPNPETAKAFVNYLLSEAGQMVLFSPEIGRLPVLPDLYAKGPKNYPNPFTMKLGGVDFDNKLSSGRRDIVNSLYDHIITFRHRELKEAWGIIYKAEESIAKGKGQNLAQALSLVAEAKKLASQAPINDKRASDKEVAAAFKSKSGLKAQLETEWENFARANYAKAKELADKALALAR
jgi:ABC-type Fe3+ transport system substrate-binding protein